MVIDGLNIVNFHFSKVFNDAIEAKLQLSRMHWLPRTSWNRSSLKHSK